MPAQDEQALLPLQQGFDRAVHGLLAGVIQAIQRAVEYQQCRVAEQGAHQEGFAHLARGNIAQAAVQNVLNAQPGYPGLKLFIRWFAIQNDIPHTCAGVCGVRAVFRVIQLAVPGAQRLGLFETHVGNPVGE